MTTRRWPCISLRCNLHVAAWASGTSRLTITSSLELSSTTCATHAFSGSVSSLQSRTGSPKYVVLNSLLVPPGGTGHVGVAPRRGCERGVPSSHTIRSCPASQLTQPQPPTLFLAHDMIIHPKPRDWEYLTYKFVLHQALHPRCIRLQQLWSFTWEHTQGCHFVLRARLCLARPEIGSDGRRCRHFRVHSQPAAVREGHCLLHEYRLRRSNLNGRS